MSIKHVGWQIAIADELLLPKQVAEDAIKQCGALDQRALDGPPLAGRKNERKAV
jgi:hypothetical protein